MSKKDFIALADMIREHNRIANDGMLRDQTFNQAHIDALADFCQRQNSAFKRDRWLGYIAGTNGVNGGVK